MGFENLLIKNAVRLKGFQIQQRLKWASRNPKKTQTSVLRKILEKKALSSLGEKFRFSEIKSIRHFQMNVPLSCKESLEAERNFHATQPLHYAVDPHHELLLFNLVRKRPLIFFGKILDLNLPEDEKTSFEEPEGSQDSIANYFSVPSLLEKKNLLSQEILGIEDDALRSLTLLRLALPHRRLSYLTCPGPTTLDHLLQALHSNWDSLIEDLKWGSFHRLDALSPKQRKAIAKQLKPNPDRAHELKLLGQQVKQVQLKQVWPEIQAVGIWTGGKNKKGVDQIKEEFSTSTLIWELGYLSSETLSQTPTSSPQMGIPAFTECFFEFVEEENWDHQRSELKTLDELELGKRYLSIVTTPMGLYRYPTGDIFEVKDFLNKTPLISFVRKERRTTSLTGERLKETQFLQALSKTERTFQIENAFFILAGIPEERNYTLFYEPTQAAFPMIPSFQKKLESQLDLNLRKMNASYEDQRRENRLKPLSIKILRQGSAEHLRVLNQEKRTDSPFFLHCDPSVLTTLNACLDSAHDAEPSLGLTREQTHKKSSKKLRKA